MPPAEHTQYSTTDPEEGHAFLAEAYAANAMRIHGSRDDFRLSYDRLQVGPLNCARITYGLPITHHVEPLGQLLLARVLDGRVERTTDGASSRMETGDVFLVAAPDAPYTISWDDMTLEMIAVDLPLLRDLHESGVPVFTSLEPLTPALARQCAAVMDLARNALSSTEQPPPLLVDNIARTVSAAVLATFPHRRLGDTTPLRTEEVPTIQEQAVRMACDYLHEHVGEPIALLDIARAARVAPRTLQLAFRRHLDTTPLAYLRDLRLERAHHDLLAGDPASGTSVTDVAMRWGFLHPSRFAAAYRTRYGRAPRETLHG